MVTSPYDHIWDCCCDHGFLGASLLSQHGESCIHFVDIVPQLIIELDKKLNQFYTNKNWKTHCLDVSKLPLAQYNDKHLIIIAGIGGDLMIKFIDELYAQYGQLDIDFLLCPVHHQFSLRQKLISLDFSLIKEVLLEENKRFYEIIFVSTQKDKDRKIHPVGDQIWQSETQTQTDIINRYLSKTLSHYQRINQGNTKGIQQIIDAYQAVNR